MCVGLQVRWCHILLTLLRYEELSDGDVAFKMVNENASVVCIRVYVVWCKLWWALGYCETVLLQVVVGTGVL